MAEKEQIKEMARDIRINMQITPNPKKHPSYQMARLLIKDGYRRVVRCKECKWLLPHKYIEGYDGNCDLSGCEVCNDDYCSRGEISNERKD